MAKLSFLLFLPVLLIAADDSLSTTTEGSSNGDQLLPKESPDSMETREQVRNILARIRMKPTQLKRVSFKAKGTNETIKMPNKPPGPSIVDLNKDVSQWMYQGDMLLSVEQAQQIAEAQQNSTRKKRAATTNVNNYWNSNTPINYFMDTSILNDQKKYGLVQKAVQYWQANTCLTFTNNPNGANALRYFIGSGCWSYVGKQAAWKTQDISIGNGCENFGTVTHETAHALGFYHQQSRYDRDNYLSVNYANIATSVQSNFVKLTPATETSFGIPFDYSSVMQYDAYAFAMDPSIPTMIPTYANYENAMGQRESPVFSDVMMVNYLYNCSQRCTSKPNCQNSGIVNSRACNQCLCPRQFSGSTCTGLATGSAPTCNGKIIQATSSWQTFNATAGDPNSYDPTVPVGDCYWHIQAPTGSKVSLYITGSSMCQDGCHFQSYEINTGQFALGGMVLCCDTSLLTSTGNLMTIRGKTTYNQLRFIIHYRYV